MNVERLISQMVQAFVTAVEAKDRYTNGHSLRVADYSLEMCRLLDYDIVEQRKVYMSALLHDIGKIGIPDAILNKTAGLTDDEYNIIKQHPVIGANILDDITELPELAIGAHYHHERWDGNGYPDGLKEMEIPVIAQIISVADAYDAMTSNRSYRNLLEQEVVRREIERGIGTQFNPEFAEIMINMIDNDKDYMMCQQNWYRAEHRKIKII